MSERTLMPDDAGQYAKFRPERTAWSVLLTSFTVFCVICITSTIGLQYFFFQSTLPMQTVLQVGRGTVGIREGVEAEQAETRLRELSGGISIRTDRIDSLSQATLSFYDGDALVAMLILRGDTQVRFERASKPRFEWSVPVYEIELVDFAGRADIIITQAVNRDIVLAIRTQDGAEARFGDAGRYTFSATDTRTRLMNYRGQAILIAPNRQATSSIPPGEEGRIAGDDNAILRQPAFDQLLKNSQLSTYEPGITHADNNIFGLPREPWACRILNTPRGAIHAHTLPGGHDTLQLVRMNGATNNGEVRCEQFLGDPATGFGMDVTSYDYLALQVLVKIDYQSLSACGSQASECPLMLRIDYFDRDGVKKQWYQGIYARIDPGVDYRLSCDSCPRDHVFLYEGAWYLYDSGNLFDLFQPGVQPTAITDVTFYASGHQYNVYVDEVSLLAGRLAPMPPTTELMDAANNNR